VLTGNEPTVAAARARLEAGKRIGALAPDPRRGIAWMMSRLAADLSRDKPVPLALLFARTGTFMAPDIAATWLIAGDVLARSGQNESALIAYAAIPANDPLAGPAADRRASVLETLGRNADAGALLQAAVAAPDASADDWTRLGDWHRRADRFDAAIDAYSRAIATAGPDAGWGLYFLRGSMNERAAHWPAAQADLREALKRSPDEPIVLNYLGYSMLDRGENQAEAVALVERAAKLRPGDGGVIDSLGWAEYRQGRYADAVTTLEKAIALEPNDPTVAEHLGDAYWQVGRRIEARFRWQQAIDLDPTAAQKKALIAKLDYGLDAALAMAAGPR
jgi:tetratricopeptide (TPR) repeat protein